MMTVVHIITESDTLDNQVSEVRGASKHECVNAYLARNAWDAKAKQGIERTAEGKVIVRYKEEVCILTHIVGNVLSARWVWTND
jgi:hypothetical protein